MRYKPERTQQYSEREMQGIIMRLYPQLLLNRIRHGRYLDLLITHAPPFGIHDKQDLTHRGFNSFLRFMRLFRPRYLLHGHIHRDPNRPNPITQYHQTTVINVYPKYYFQLEIN